MTPHDDLSGVSRRHQDEGVYAGEPLGLTGEKHWSGPETIAGELVARSAGEVLLRRNRTGTSWLENRQLQSVRGCCSVGVRMNVGLGWRDTADEGNRECGDQPCPTQRELLERRPQLCKRRG